MLVRRPAAGHVCFDCGKEGGAGARAQLVSCQQCGQFYHRSCLGLPDRSCLAGCLPQCGDCALFELKVLDIESQEEVLELHKEGLVAEQNNVTEGTMGNYFSYLYGKGASLARFAKEVLWVEEWEVMPATPGVSVALTVVCLYLVWASKQLAMSSLGNYINAIAKWHQAKGIPQEQWPTEHPRVKARLKGIKRQRGEKDGGRGAKAPISVGLLGAMCAYWEERAVKDPGVALLCFKQVAILLLGFFGLMRAAELVDLRVGDVTVWDWGVEIKIRKSKADQYKKGAVVRIASTTRSGFGVGAAVNRYLTVLRASGRGQEDFLFPRWDCGQLGMKGMSKRGVADIIRDSLEHVRKAAEGALDFLDPLLFAGHSLRRGGLNAGRRAGNSKHQSKLHGRWRSDAIEAYDELGLDEQIMYTAVM